MADLFIATDISIPEQEIDLIAVRSQGAGGQNVNKVASAIHLRFDIHQSSLPEEVKQKLLSRNDQRITSEGLIVLKVQQSRSQLQNRQLAVIALQQLIQSVLVKRRPRKKTRPGAAAAAKRIKRKKLRGQVKTLRQKVEH
ncbi:alternative ribosome rescue aminoacyl-tRNA hydrolase ArfB [Pelovirga terrestris]|uniref:Aminoacyl-tRNA hydrolase n=1 Tax=Pelovirga terrestris TaxID=2771352 RepID=A0A8J6QSY7_9BACT|nr:alternative ribosome rescue aminoacyl-tRNA hydrolase ArfB [Pelovirga terrestris]MBD1401290.1 aminoacyl-tRNA hydrolase [Pelovirga terrestris]